MHKIQQVVICRLKEVGDKEKDKNPVEILRIIGDDDVCWQFPPPSPQESLTENPGHGEKLHMLLVKRPCHSCPVALCCGQRCCDQGVRCGEGNAGHGMSLLLR